MTGNTADGKTPCATAAPLLVELLRSENMDAIPSKETTDPESIISPDFLGPDNLAALKTEFAASQPFAHVVFRELCNRDMLLKGRRELIDNVEAKFKETDLFKVSL